MAAINPLWSAAQSIASVGLKLIAERRDVWRSYAIGKLIDEGAIQEIMTKMFYPPETKSMDTAKE
jgi:hypothetical protein